MSSDDQLGIALANMSANFALPIVLKGACEQDHPVPRIFENAASRKVMLLGENLSRCHERDLIAIFHGDDGSFESHNCFAGADVALQQTAHGKRFLHVRGNFFEHTFLCFGGMEGQNFLDSFAHSSFERKCDSSFGFLLTAL